MIKDNWELLDNSFRDYYMKAEKAGEKSSVEFKFEQIEKSVKDWNDFFGDDLKIDYRDEIATYLEQEYEKS